MARDAGGVAAGGGGVSTAPDPPHEPGTTSDVENEQQRQEQEQQQGQQQSICQSIGNAVYAPAHCSTCSPPVYGASVPPRRPVRMLLIDNYDSYTYNLFQLMIMVNGG